ncbi:hypothetical protein D3C79_1117250 [compost metagenome]
MEKSHNPISPLPYVDERTRQISRNTQNQTAIQSSNPGMPSSMAMWVNILCEWSNVIPKAGTV